MNKNVIVGQSGGPTSVINASLAGVFAEAKKANLGTIFGMRNGIKGFLERRNIDMGQYIKDELDVELLKRTPSSFLGSCRYKLPKIEENEEVYHQIFEILNTMGVGYFFYIGGNDSMDTIMKLSAYGEATGSPIRFMGVPKTIDNDLAVTDHSPGFGSAAKYIAATIKELVLDAQVYNNGAVTIVEVMGRNTGWLAAAASLARGADSPGPDLIFLPEITFNVGNFMDKVAKISSQSPAATIVVSEGIKLADGRYVNEIAAENNTVDAFGHKQLSGTASYLSQEVHRNLGVKTRAIEFATIQRCAAHLQSAVDVQEAYAVGAEAVKAAMTGATNRVTVIRRLSSEPYAFGIDAIEIAQMANIEKKVPLEWVTSSRDDVTQEYIDYARPLIQGEVAPYFVGGMPRHIRLS
ncbi:MAG: 6-phosphofructokinase [Defluviitaleaceae bacterium]|nr:6-phosphofructokinase [Defluviitaleaceae bacterium]